MHQKGRMLMSDLYPLTRLKTDECARVAALKTKGTMRRRLQDMGLVEGTRIRCVLKGPGGDPIAYQIRGAVIALRAEDANTVFVT